jgi:putative membrane protein
MKSILAGVLVCSAFALAAMAQAPASGDQEFLDLAAQTDMMEAHLGQLAADKADAQAVKDLAQMLVTDHTADYNKLGTLAAKANLTIAKALDAKHNKMIAPFEKLKGKMFDRRYTQEMVKGHTDAIAAYQKEASDGQNADLKAYAQATLPTLEKHRTAAQDAQKAK